MVHVRSFVEFDMDFVYPECCPLAKLFPPLKPLCKKVCTPARAPPFFNCLHHTGRLNWLARWLAGWLLAG